MLNRTRIIGHFQIRFQYILNSDLKKSRICPILGQSDSLLYQILCASAVTSSSLQLFCFPRNSCVLFVFFCPDPAPQTLRAQSSVTWCLPSAVFTDGGQGSRGEMLGSGVKSWVSVRVRVHVRTERHTRSVDFCTELEYDQSGSFKIRSSDSCRPYIVTSWLRKPKVQYLSHFGSI